MPTYEYECSKCGHVFEVRQSFSDAPVTKCVACSGKVKKLFSAPAIIFKGKGWHCTDYKTGGSATTSTCTSCPKDKPAAESCPASGCGSEKCAAT